jgi:polyisoprenoid-binding protein YceI
MANSFSAATVDWATAQALRLLLNKLSVAEAMNTDYGRDYEMDFPVGETIRVPLPQRWLIREGLGYTPQPINRINTTITVDQIFGLDFQMDSIERALKQIRNEQEVARLFMESPMAKLAQEIDSRAAFWGYQNTTNIVGILGTSPTSMQTYNQARQRLVELAGFDSKARMIISPAMQVALGNAVSTVFNPAPTISSIFKKGALLGAQGAAGFDDWYESMSIYQHTAGTWAGAVTVNLAGQSGNTLNVNCTTGDTFFAGDVFNIANVNATNPETLRSTGTLKQFRITQPVTGAASAATLTIDPPIIGPGSQYQNVDSLPANAAALTLFPGTTSPSGKVGVNGLAFTRDAFALVGVKLEEPKGSVEYCKVQRDPETGIAVRYLKQFLGQPSIMIERFDVLIGFGNLYNDNCSVRVLGQ